MKTTTTINEKITTVERRLPMLEDRSSRESEMKVNAEDYHKTQGDQNQRRAVATGFHDDTAEQEVEDLLKGTIVAM